MEKLRVLITGANRGLGLAMTKHVLSLGHNVIACRRSGSRENEKGEDFINQNSHDSEIEQLDKLYSDHSERLTIKTLNLMELSSFENFADSLSTESTKTQLDIIINVAGVLIDPVKNDSKVNFANLTENDLLTSFKVNAIAPLFLTRALLDNLQKSSSPKVVFFTSQMGSIEDNSSGGYYAYRSSKAALNMLQKSLSIDFSNVTTLAVHPGWVKTRMGGKNATLDVDDSASGIWKQITLMKNENSGKFVDYSGKQIMW